MSLRLVGLRFESSTGGLGTLLGVHLRSSIFGSGPPRPVLPSAEVFGDPSSSSRTLLPQSSTLPAPWHFEHLTPPAPLPSPPQEGQGTFLESVIEPTLGRHEATVGMGVAGAVEGCT